MEVGEVGEKHLRLDHVIERGAGGLEGLFQVFEDVRRLQLDVRAVERKARLLARLRRHAGSIIAGDLTSCEHVAAQGEALAVVGERTGSCRLDHLVLETTARPVTDEVDFHERVFHQQSRAADGGTRRRHLEVALPHRVEAVKVTEVGEKDLRLDHVIER